MLDGVRSLLVPVEVSPLGLVPQDGLYRDGGLYKYPGIEEARTLVLRAATLPPAFWRRRLTQCEGKRQAIDFPPVRPDDGSLVFRLIRNSDTIGSAG